MSSPFIGEIRMFAGNFAPAGWAFCAGQTMAISENDTLFNLIGTTYGGDGQETFNLPDLRGRVPMHVGGFFSLGENGGTETVLLTQNQIPAHTHPPAASAAAATATGTAGNVWAASNNYHQFVPGPGTVPMSAGTILPYGGSQPHDNMLPYLTINFIISLFGVFPTQS